MIRLSGAGSVALAALLATGFGCGARNLVEDAGGGSGPAGSSGAGDGPPAYDVTLVPDEVISDFPTQVGRINLTGTPPRNGYWYTYNDASTSCAQQPAPTGVYDPSLPPKPSPGPSGGFALHAIWRGCDVWGAGIGAYLNMSAPSDGAAGTPQPYDLSAFGGFTFWGMAAPGSNGKLRFKVVMRAETHIRDGGNCDEAVVGVNKCLDSWGEMFTLPATGVWWQVVVRFSDAAFKQEAWGAQFPWNPADVTGIQIQSMDISQPFDFWIDDVYLIR